MQADPDLRSSNNSSLGSALRTRTGCSSPSSVWLWGSLVVMGVLNMHREGNMAADKITGYCRMGSDIEDADQTVHGC